MYKTLGKVRGLVVFFALITFLFSIIYSIAIRGFDGVSLIAVILAFIFFAVDLWIESKDK